MSEWVNHLQTRQGAASLWTPQCPKSAVDSNMGTILHNRRTKHCIPQLHTWSCCTGTSYSTCCQWTKEETMGQIWTMEEPQAQVCEVGTNHSIKGINDSDQPEGTRQRKHSRSTQQNTPHNEGWGRHGWDCGAAWGSQQHRGQWKMNGGVWHEHSAWTLPLSSRRKGPGRGREPWNHDRSLHISLGKGSDNVSV